MRCSNAAVGRGHRHGIAVLGCTLALACSTAGGAPAPAASTASRAQARPNGDRALLIGVGRHQVPAFDLPGIDLDLDMMEDVAASLGFSRGQVRVLRDREVTKASIRQAFDEFLMQAGPSDRVLVYFSGHGTHLRDRDGDEQDKRDEALVMSNAPQSRRGTAGLLLDDELNALMRSLRTSRQLLFVDACHSGTVYRSVLPVETFGRLANEGLTKYIRWNDGSAPLTRGVVRKSAGVSEQTTAEARPGFVALTAAADHERSLATASGSLFTLGVSQSVHDAIAADTTLSMAGLAQQVSAFVREKLADGQVELFHPQVYGTPADAPLWGATEPAVNNARGPYWRRAEGLLEGIEALRIAANQMQFRVGDPLRISIDVPFDGYLNVISVGPDDQAVVLFPNRFDSANRVKKGAFEFPTGKMSFDIQAQPPTGDAIVVAIVTEAPRNFMEESLSRRAGIEENYRIQEPFGGVSYRSFSAVPRNNGASGPPNATRRRAGARVVLTVIE